MRRFPELLWYVEPPPVTANTNRQSGRNLAQFTEFTGADRTAAQNYLKRHNNDLVLAVDDYLSQNKGKRAAEKPLSALLTIYQKYQDPKNVDLIDIDGTIQYLSDLDINPDDPKALILAYFLKSPSVGIFTKEKFLNQWQSQRVTTINEMKIFVNTLYDRFIYNKEVDGVEYSFQDVYNYTFTFLMTNENQKLLDLEVAVDYWKLLLPLISQNLDVTTRFDQWNKFISEEYKRSISKDTWSMLFLFIYDVIIKDPIQLRDYDEMSAWPSVIDEFIEYLRENELLECQS